LLLGDAHTSQKSHEESMIASTTCPHADCGHALDTTSIDSFSTRLCPKCGRPLSETASAGAVLTLDLPQPSSGPAIPDSALTLDLPQQGQAASPDPAETLAKSTEGLSTPATGPAVTLDLPAATPPVVPPTVTLDLPSATPPVAPSTTETLEGTGRFDRLGRFTIVRFLGEGGFGRVYEAHDPHLDRRIALKVARPERLADERSMSLFVREARAAGNLRHPNIIAVFDSGKDGSHYFIASAFIDGKSLDKRLTELAPGQTLPFRKSVVIVRKLAEALAYAHSRGVVHRDVKPANVMIDETGEPLIMDFGLAARAAEREAKADEQRSMGTPAYMAPEQGHGKAEAASDQYSLGCTLYELLTGQTPFGGSAEIQVFLHQTQPPPRPRQVNPAVPLDLEAICLRCLHKEPGQRYPDCQEFADDLRRWLDGEPVRARRVGLVERSIKWVRRKPFQAVSALSGLLVVALLVFSGWREARDYRLKYERKLQSEEYRSDRERDYHDVEQLIANRQLAEARSRLEGIQKGLEAMSDLDAGDLADRVKQKLADVDLAIQADRNQEQAVARLKAFRKPYRDAVFTQVSLTGRGAREDRARTRASAQEALENYGLHEKPSSTGRLVDRLEHDRRFLSPVDFAWLSKACYELLVIWAQVEAVDQSEKNEQRAAARRRGTRALALLERAGVLGKAYGLPTQTYYIHKARYLALIQDAKAPPVPFDADAPAEPTGAMDWFFRGLESYQQAGQLAEADRPARYREAIAALEQAVTSQSDHFWAYYLQGLCHLGLGRWREARVVLTISLNLQPDFAWTRVQRGFAAIEQGAVFRAQAERQTRRAIQQRRLLENADAIFGALREMESEFALAHSDLDDVLKQPRLDDQARYAALVNRGVLYIRRREWENAIADLKQAMAVDPAAYQAHADLAQALHGEGRHEEALAAIGRAIECAPDLPELYLVRAQMSLGRKNRSGVLADYKRAIARDLAKGPSRRLAETFVKVGQLLLEEKEYSAALVQFERALKASPELVLTERFRATALLGLERKDEAAAALDSYLERTPNPIPEALQARGLLHAEKGGADRLRLAIQLYSAALRLKPTGTITRGQRAWAYLESGANRLSLEDFNVCLAEQPASAEYLTGRAAARVRLRRVSEAMADAEAAERMGTLTDRLSYHLSCVYAQAIVQVGLEAGTQRNRQAEQAIARYEGKALLHLSRVLEVQPVGKRAQFWRERVEKDPALTGIRSARVYFSLARKYGGEVRGR
jgi:tRNA A-37 threonylcarbamoyl transferase component Bud32/lipoprotein NlpI